MRDADCDGDERSEMSLPIDDGSVDPYNICSERSKARVEVKAYEVDLCEWSYTLVHQVEIEGGRQDKEETKG